jgi:hypothetical protein
LVVVVIDSVFHRAVIDDDAALIQRERSLAPRIGEPEDFVSERTCGKLRRLAGDEGLA